jgi:hypothetical protein
VAGVDKFEKATHYLFSSHYTLIESDISSEIESKGPKPRAGAKLQSLTVRSRNC